MRKTRSRLLLVLTVAILLVVTGCATTVTMRYMVPAEINMASYTNLAVVSVEPYRFTAFTSPSATIKDMSGTSPYRVASGFGDSTELRIAQYLTQKIIQDLRRTDYFNLMTPPDFDALGIRYQRFKEQGYDALLMVDITDLKVEEYIFAQEETVIVPPEVEGGESTTIKELRHHVTQKIALNVEFTVVDTGTGQTVATKSYSDSREQTYKIEPGSTGASRAPELYRWMASMADSFSRSFSELIAPRWTTKAVALMDNKPENKRVENAYEAAKEGSLGMALETFKREWEQSNHVPSGYNAAIILESFGRYDEAIKLIGEVWRYSGNRTVENRKIEMERAYEDHLKAQKQL